MRRRKIRGIALALALVLCAPTALTGCNNSASSQNQTDTQTKEIRQNDYRGSVIRTQAIKTRVVDLVQKMMGENAVIRSGKPDNFWSDEDYKDFVLNFITDSIINDTGLLNEEETNWDTVVSTTLKSANSFTVAGGEGGYQSKYPSISIERLYKDHYAINGVTGVSYYEGLISGDLTYRIDYDCDEDMAGAYATMMVSADGTKEITPQMFEYRRLSDDAFIIQTSNERVYVEFAPVSEAAAAVESTAEDSSSVTNSAFDIRNREIKRFYYSRLSDGIRSTFNNFKFLPLYGDDGFWLDENQRKNQEFAKLYMVNENGDLADKYGENDSIFTSFHTKSVTADGKTTRTYLDDKGNEVSFKDWVFADTALRQGIIYEDGAMVVNSYNNLTKEYDQFVYYAGADDAAKASAKTAAEKLAADNPVSKLTGYTKLISIQISYENFEKESKGNTTTDSKKDNKKDGDSSKTDDGKKDDKSDYVVNEKGELVKKDSSGQQTERDTEKQKSEQEDKGDEDNSSKTEQKADPSTLKEPKDDSSSKTDSSSKPSDNPNEPVR